MDKRKIVLALVALVVVVAAAFGYSLSRPQEGSGTNKATEVAARKEERLQDACASSATYARLKQVAFEEAVRIRNADPTNLDTLAAQSVVRMENPVVKSRDEALNTTVCTGRFVLELPPGAERAFGGERRLTADVEYAAQGAADGSGVVYQMEGAEPIIYKLAAFDLKGQGAPAAPAEDELELELAEADTSSAAVPVPVRAKPRSEEPSREREVASRRPEREEAPEPRPTRRAEPREEPKAAPKAAPRPTPRPKAEARAERPEPRTEARPARAAARPSFNCRVARSRSEQMVCNNARLAARDRAMSAQFYSALTDASPRARRELRRTRDRFLAYRERCRDEACIADAYEGRMREINDIMAAE